MGNRVEVHDKGEEVQPIPGGKVCWSLGIHLHDCGRPARKSFVKPFWAQANAPLHGFDMSPALPNAASWWTKFLELSRRSAWQWPTP